MEKILSIIIPTYNMANLLPRCLDSLVSPGKSEAIEVLVINDGSKDNSLAIAKEYENKYPSIIKAIDKENGNYGSTINKGIQIAKGKYFRILDSDDFYDNQELMRFTDHISTLDVDLILTNFTRERNGKVVKKYTLPIKKYNIVQKFEDVNISDFSNFAMHGITYRTTVLKNNNITLSTGISYTDTEFCFYPLRYIKSFISLNYTVYQYQIGRSGQTVEINSLVRNIPHMLKIIRRMEAYLKKSSLIEPYIKNQKQIMSNIIELCTYSILCFDKDKGHKSDLNYLIELISSDKLIEANIINSKVYGIKYYQRYIKKGKWSNTSIYKTYYAIRRQLVALCSKL